LRSVTWQERTIGSAVGDLKDFLFRVAVAVEGLKKEQRRPRYIQELDEGKAAVKLQEPALSVPFRGCKDSVIGECERDGWEG
jgi:hypothetical protein